MPLPLLVACLQAATLDAEAGYQGTVFPDAWTRFSATVSYEGERLDGELRITLRSYSSEPVVYRRNLSLFRKSRMRVGYDLYLTGEEYVAEVELIGGGKRLNLSSLPLAFNRQSDLRLLTIGPPPGFLVEAMAKRPPVTMLRLAPELLPTSVPSLLGVDAIVIPEPIDLEAGQESALREWVARGGRLIFGAGRSTHLRLDPFWRDRCPLASPEMTTISVPWKDSTFPLSLVRGALRRGRASHFVGADPAVVRSPEGSGEIIFLAVALDQPNLGRLLPAPALLADLLNLPPPPPDDPRFRRVPVLAPADPVTRRSQRPVFLREIPDLLRLLLTPDFRLNVKTLALGVGILVLYLAIIGPFEYLRLRKKGQLRKGWVSLGMFVLVFSGIVLLWGGHFSPRTPKLALVSLWDEGRIATYVLLRPARGGEYDLQSAGAITALGPSRGFGAGDPPAPTTVDLQGQARLRIPPSALRMVFLSRPVEPGEGAFTAEWPSGDRGKLLVKNTSAVPLKECWVVSKDSVWSAGEIPATSSRTVLLKDAEPFSTWGPKLLNPRKDPYDWWQRDRGWERMGLARTGLAISFFEALHDTWALNDSRHVLYERGIDLSPGLERGETYLMGSFEKSAAGARLEPEIAADTYGWARVRVREAGR